MTKHTHKRNRRHKKRNTRKQLGGGFADMMAALKTALDGKIIGDFSFSLFAEGNQGPLKITRGEESYTVDIREHIYSTSGRHVNFGSGH